MRTLFMLVLMAQTLSAQSIPEVRTAVTRALPLLQRSASEFVAKRACVSCHHNILPILTLHLAQNRGFTIERKVLGAVEEKSFRELRNPNALDDAVQAANLSDPTLTRVTSRWNQAEAAAYQTGPCHPRTYPPFSGGGGGRRGAQ